LTARRSLRTLGLGLVVSAVFACRAIIGVESDLTYGPAPHDGGTLTDGRENTRDASADRGAHTHDGATRDAKEVDATACSATTPEVLFSTADPLGPILVNGTYVYAEVVNTNSALYAPYSGLLGCPKAGCDGGPSLLFDYTNDVAGLQWGGAYATDADLYFTVSSPDASVDGGDEAGDGFDAGVDDATDGHPDAVAHVDAGLAPGAVEQANVNGTGEKPLVPHLTYPFFIGATADSLYWVNDPNSLSQWVTSYGLLVPWTVLRCPLAGCETPTVFMVGTDYDTYAFYVDSSNVFVVSSNSDDDSTIVYCPEDGGCHESPISVTTTKDSVIGTSTGPPYSDPLAEGASIAGDGTYLYLASYYSGDIDRITPATQATIRLVTSPGCESGDSECPISIALDSTYVYWASDEGSIYRIAKDGTGSQETLACNLPSLAAIAVQGGYVYFTYGDPTNINRTAVARIVAP
jgi:hypothetical protein